MTAAEARRRLKALANPEIAVHSAGFFKTGPGQYGEGDKFIGVRVPELRKLARDCKQLPLAEVETLLHSPIHEQRLLALLILGLTFANSDEAGRKSIYDLYLRNTQFVNNWDLVDSSAPYLVGAYLIDKDRKPLVALARSENLWQRRIAIVATQHFIRQDDFTDTLKISRLLLADREDLIHKATGWMLREVGKRDTPTLEAFLGVHAAIMPRTMLRYAIERFSPERKQYFMSRKGLQKGE
jgi:3-methyladenine DNA glycosylase AlkD